MFEKTNTVQSSDTLGDPMVRAILKMPMQGILDATKHNESNNIG